MKKELAKWFPEYNLDDHGEETMLSMSDMADFCLSMIDYSKRCAFGKRLGLSDAVSHALKPSTRLSLTHLHLEFNFISDAHQAAIELKKKGISTKMRILISPLSTHECGTQGTTEHSKAFEWKSLIPNVFGNECHKFLPRVGQLYEEFKATNPSEIISMQLMKANASLRPSAERSKFHARDLPIVRVELSDSVLHDCNCSDPTASRNIFNQIKKVQLR